MGIAMIIQVSVSINRLNKFLNADELDTNAVSHEESYGRLTTFLFAPT